MNNTRPTAAQPRITTLDPVPGFAPGIGRYVAQLTRTCGKLLREVANLSPERLAWYPNDETESIGTQLLHVAAIEWSWIFQGIFGRPDEEFDGWEETLPIRVNSPQVTGKPLAYFTERLERVRMQCLAALCGLSDEDLPRLVGEAPPNEGEEPHAWLYSMDWILFHLVEHEAHHVGQVELLRRLLPATLS